MQTVWGHQPGSPRQGQPGCCCHPAHSLWTVRPARSRGGCGVPPWGSSLLPPVGPACVCVLVTRSCPTLCDPTDCSPPGSSVHGILQERILEWVATSFSRGSYQPWDCLQADSLPLSHQGSPVYSLCIHRHINLQIHTHAYTHIYN